jgi:HEPN domain-containing protein
MATEIEKIMGIASQFQDASGRCFEKRPLPGTHRLAPVPAVVCLAFSIELYLKAILSSEGNPQKGHELHKLFIKLSQKSKDNICSTLSKPEEEIRTTLTSNSKAFVEWRYIYEKDSASVNTKFLLEFSRAVSELAKKMADK